MELDKKNCLILGSGRSGTSMLAGILHDAGYFLGDQLYKPSQSNPKGFFEWNTINRINEDILHRYAGANLKSALIRLFLNKGSVYKPIGKNQRWLLSLPLQVTVDEFTPDLAADINRVLAREPFCYKDPRFSYTLPVWQKFLKPDTVFICVFREPDITVNSILQECHAKKYLHSLYINRTMAYEVWINIYSHIVNKHSRNNNLIFVHYNQIFNGTALPMLSKAIGVALHDRFIDPSLKRSLPGRVIPGRVRALYLQLCRMANYRIA